MGEQSQDIKKVLGEYIETWNTGNYSRVEDMDELFPELKSYDKKALGEYIETWNTGKYQNLDAMNELFPEFFPEVKKKIRFRPIFGWQISIERV